MPYFTSWDINVLLCLVKWGLPEDVVKGMLKMTKKIHEDYIREESLEYWSTLPDSCGTIDLADTKLLWVGWNKRKNLKEFSELWRLRSIEERQKKVIEWCKFGDEQEQQIHQHRIKVYNPPVYRRYKFVKNLWRTWEAGASSYYFVGWDKRVYISKWYEGIHPGRFFLFYKENEIIQERNKGVARGPCEDGYKHPQTPIFDWGPYEQLIEDLLTIDGGGLGEKPGNPIEHIDDLFSFI